MSEQPSSPNGLSNPQILAAVITAVTGVVVALISVVPNLINNNQAPTPTAIIVTATPIPTITTPTQANTAITEATIVPTEHAEPTTVSEPPNIRLIYDSVAFTLVNESGDTLSLENVSFRSSAGSWDARMWGPSLYDRLPAGQCFRLRDRNAGQRQPPPPCVNKIFSLIEVGSTGLFWVNVPEFEVVRNGDVIATCAFEAAECALYIPSS